MFHGKRFTAVEMAIVGVLLFLVSGLAYAVMVSTTTIMDAQVFNNATTSANSTALFCQGADKISFFVKYNETDTGTNISVAVKPQISFDNSTWSDASFYDYAAGSTLQTSETISTNSTYYFWFNKDLVVPYVRVNVAATNTDASNIANVTVQAETKE